VVICFISVISVLSVEWNNMEIVLIGAGNLATQLARSFLENDLKIVQVYSRTIEAARTLAMQIDAEFTDSPAAIRRKADVYICALKDDALPNILPQLSDCQGIFAHTAGSVPMQVFAGMFPHFGVFYPLQSFSKAKNVSFSDIPLLIEGNDGETETFLLNMAGKLSRNVRLANSRQRAAVHLAAVFACNFSNRMYALAEDILQKADLPFDLMLPLIDETAQKIHSLSPQKAQTGPAVRYDTSIIDKHIGMLDDPLTREIYQNISKSIFESKK
jgi:predicted short-subunit dehydrogenase-like oxidoreductase (DUF2520 family)